MQEYKDKNIIHFNVEIREQEHTKGTPINSASDELFTEFGLFAYHTTDYFDYEEIPTEFYFNGDFDNKTVIKTDNNQWTLDATYYWPQNGYISFFAYAPYTSGSSNGIKLVYEDNDIPSITYTVPNNFATQPDLMVAVPQLNIFKETVDIKFAHALACIGFNISAPDVRVDSIWITGIKTTGSLSLDFDGTTPTWSDIGNNSDENFTFGIITDAVADTSGSGIMVSDGYLMMIPQSLTSDAYMMIQFENMDIKKVALSSTSIKEWIAGYKYTYSLKEGDYDFSVTVDTETCEYMGGVFNFTITSTYTPYNSTAQDLAWTVSIVPDTAVSDTSWLKGFNNLSGTGGTDLTRQITVGAAIYDQSLANAMDQQLANATFSTMTDLSYYNNPNYTTSFNETFNSSNCYIVSAPGYYKFPCWVIGNGLLKASNSDRSVAANNQNCFPDRGNMYVDYSGKTITSVTDLEIDTTGALAGLLWMDAPQLVSDVTITDDNNYISFYVDKETIRQGNAVIGIFDSSGTIMWSWHIWITPWSIYSTSTSENLAFFSHSIGTCYKGTYSYGKRQAKLLFQQNESNNTVELLITQLGDSLVIEYNSPYYQWGRKDPMLPSNGEGGNKRCYGNVLFDITETSGSVSLETVIQNPNLFYRSSGSWLNNEEINLWHVKKDEVDYKSIYDPSPITYIVPSRESMSQLEEGLGWSSNGFGNYSFKYNITDSDVSYLTLLANGYRDSESGEIESDNSNGNYWTSTYENATDSYYLFFNSSSTSDFVGPSVAASGYCVNPIIDAN